MKLDDKIEYLSQKKNIMEKIKQFHKNEEEMKKVLSKKHFIINKVIFYGYLIDFLFLIISILVFSWILYFYKKDTNMEQTIISIDYLLDNQKILNIKSKNL